MTAHLQVKPYRPLNNEAWKAARRGMDWLQKSGPRHGFNWTRMTMGLKTGSPKQCPLAQAADMDFMKAAKLGVKAQLHDDGYLMPGELHRLENWAFQRGFLTKGHYMHSELDYAWRTVLAVELILAEDGK